MKRVLIIEDERLSANRLKRLIADIDDTIIIDGPLTTVAEVTAALQEVQPYDLIFSDIRLGEDLVFEAFQGFTIPAPIIFTTVYDEYAIAAFKHNGIAYLLKPIDADSLSDAIQKFENLKKLTDPLISATVSELKGYRERILVVKGDELIPLRTCDIRYIKKEEDGLIAHTGKGETFKLTTTISELEKQLDPNLFFRLNRQYIFHIDSIRKICFHFHSKLSVQLYGEEGETILVSKERSSLLKQWLNH